MKLVRSFIAIDFPQDVKQNILVLVDAARKKIRPDHVRWVSESNLHLTLKFLGEAEEPKIAGFITSLKNHIYNNSRFDFSVSGLGVFPNQREPRILWVGCLPCPELKQMASTIEKIAREAGFPEENRPFSPHLTIGRVVKDVRPVDLKPLGEAFLSLSPAEFGMVTVDHLTLYKSDLLPTGAKYTEIRSFPLACDISHP